jgi:uncharacterized protein DUF6011
MYRRPITPAIKKLPPGKDSGNRKVVTGQLTDPAAIRTFALAGKAVLTFKSTATGTRFTFKIRRANGDDPKRPWFVKVLTGPSNHDDYAFIGTIFEDGRFRHGQKSKIARTAPSVCAFTWAWEKVRGGSLPATLEVWHEGRCGRCGRLLTVPESVASGLGPECAGRVAA